MLATAIIFKREVVLTKVLCKVSEHEFLLLRGKWFPTVILEEEHFAVLFQKEPLHLSEEGEHSWRRRLPKILKGSKRTLYVEECAYQGASKRPDKLAVAKLVCGAQGRPIAPIMGSPDKYLAPALATISRYDDPLRETVTIKELRASQLDAGWWQLIVWVWRGKRNLIGRSPNLRCYLPVVRTAEAHLQASVSRKGKGRLVTPGPA